MKIHTVIASILASVAQVFAADTIVLDTNQVKNLGVKIAQVEELDFEKTFFSLGHLEPKPESIAAVSSRISGRIVGLFTGLGQRVTKGEIVAEVESRQAGNPPPRIPLKAPISGLITEQKTHLGDPVDPDMVLLKITDLGELLAVAKVPEHMAGKIQPGTLAHMQVVALPNEKFQGKMLRFGTQADEESGTIDAVFLIKNSRGYLRASMRTEFSIVFDQRKNVLSIPRAALQGDSGDRFVYITHFEIPNAFVKAPVEVGETNDRFVEIKSGLLPGDQVVTSGAYSLSFAGAGSMSLKEALDAAHGHEHAEDGSELTGNEPKKTADGAGHTHEASPLWKYATFGLVLLLIAALLSPKLSKKNDPSC